MPFSKDGITQFKTDVQGDCQCGSRVDIEYESGQMIHTWPPCDEFVKDRPPIEYVKTLSNLRKPPEDRKMANVRRTKIQRG